MKKLILFFILIPFIINAQSIVGVSPNTGQQNQVITVSISGQNTTFQQGTNVAKLYKAGTYIYPSSTSVINNTLINATFSFSTSHPTGAYDVIVASPTLTLTSPGGFTLTAATASLASMTPTTASQGDTIIATITGTNTNFSTATNTVSLTNGGITINPQFVTVLSNTSLQVKFAFSYSNPLGYYTLHVNNSTDGNMLKNNEFLLTAGSLSPAITSISPNSGVQNQTLSVSITGQHTTFQQGTNLARLYKSGTYIYASNTTVINDTLMNATFAFTAAHPIGIYDVLVYSPSLTITLAGGFTLNAAGSSLASMTPATAAQEDTIIANITGINTSFSTGTNTVWLTNGATTINSQLVTVINNTSLQAKFVFSASDPLGYYTAHVNNSIDGNMIKSNALLLTGGPHSPGIKSISPNNAMQGQTLTVSISGRYTTFQQGSNMIKLYKGGTNIIPSGTTIINDSVIDATFSFTAGNPLGLYDVIITSPGSTLTLNSGFTLNSGGSQTASIESISPDYAVQGQTLTVSITGHNTVFQQGTNIIKLYGSGTTITPTSAGFVNDTLINATFSFTGAHPAGSYDVVIDHYLMTSTLTLSNGFTLYSPSGTPGIIGISPTSGNQGDNLTLTVTGLNTNFGSGADSLWLQDIYGDIIYPAALTILNSTSIQAQFNFTTSDMPGSYGIYESNMIDATKYLDHAFTLNPAAAAPIVSNVNPNYALTNDIVTVNITGSGTHFITGADTVSLVSSLLRSTTFIYPTSMSIINNSLIQATFDLAGADNGDYDILIQGSENIRLDYAFNIGLMETVKEITVGNVMSIYPNPSSGLFNITINKDMEDGDLSVTDIQGKILYSQKAIKKNTAVDLSAFPTGMYFVKLIKDDQIKTGKIIKNE